MASAIEKYETTVARTLLLGQGQKQQQFPQLRQSTVYPQENIPITQPPAPTINPIASNIILPRWYIAPQEPHVCSNLSRDTPAPLNVQERSTTIATAAEPQITSVAPRKQVSPASYEPTAPQDSFMKYTMPEEECVTYLPCVACPKCQNPSLVEPMATQKDFYGWRKLPSRCWKRFKSWKREAPVPPASPGTLLREEGMSLYDDFGNYIGPELSSSEGSDAELDDEETAEAHESVPEPVVEEQSVGGDVRAITAAVLRTAGATADDSIVLSTTSAVVPHEEKQYYPEAEAVYGPNVEVLVEDEDEQPITEPIIAGARAKNFDLLERAMPVTTFDYRFVKSMMRERVRDIRQVAFVGGLHCGKTSLTDILAMQTHDNETGSKWDVTGPPPRYTDSRKDEFERGLSIKATPLSLVMPNSEGKSYLVHLFDTPGHPNFQDEVAAAVRLCDGVLFVVDAITGLTCSSERLLRHVLQERVEISLIITGLDRLILELHIPPADAYHKLRHIIDEVNSSADTFCKSMCLPFTRFSPTMGNVIFASGLYGFVFTLRSFAELYCSKSQIDENRTGGWMRGLETTLEPETFSRLLWGDVYVHADGSSENGYLSRSNKGKTSSEGKRTFVAFILEPLYKLFAHTVGEERPTLEPMLQELGVYLRSEDFSLAPRPLLRVVCMQFFGDASTLVDVIVRRFPDPVEGGTVKLKHCYQGAISSIAMQETARCRHDSPLTVVHTTKSFHRPDCSNFDVFGRVFSGTLRKGEKVRVLGEGFSLADPEDAEVREVTHLWVYQAGRYRVEVNEIPAGNWALIGGLSSCIPKTSTIVNVPQKRRAHPSELFDVEIFRPLRFPNESVVRVSCEPLNPAELPKMLEGFRKCSRAYPLCRTRVEESGDVVVMGTGELFMDCVLHDLRNLYGDLEIRVADPVVQFAETIVETSVLKCSADTPNNQNKLYMSAEPLEKGLGEAIEAGLIKWSYENEAGNEVSRDGWTQQQLRRTLQDKYGWDALAARSLWAFGPDERGSNVLLNDTLPYETDQDLLSTVQESIIQGFQWVTREGPLCEEPVRGCKFKLLGANISDDPSLRGGGQIIPTARRAAYSAFLLATPRLMEPVYFVEIECPADCVAAVYAVLARRRGYVTKDAAKPGSPIYTVTAYLPVIDSFGFESDLRTHTSGQAFCLTFFDHWALVPGDPLDKTILLRPLEPAPAPHLGREFLLKTRRRKGLSEDVVVQ